MILQATLPQTRPHRPLVVLTALSVALAVLCGLWALSDGRVVEGVPVWGKPAKFALSFVVMFGTLALVEQRLSKAWRDGLLLRSTVAVLGAAMMVEMGYMIFQAAQGQASHFNFSSPFTIIMYQVMGVGALSLIAGIAVFGLAALRDRAARMGPALRLGVGSGFILSFVLTLITAGTMSSIGRHVGMVSPADPVLPLMGWSGRVGDLRPAHFLALHAMQALPLVGLWLDRRGLSARLIWPAAAVYAALTAALFAQALMGLPLIRL